MKDVEKIIQLTEKEYGLSAGAIMQHCRSRTVAEARNVAMYLSKRFTPYSYCELSKVFRRHHTSVIYGVKRVKKQLGE